MFTHNIVDNMNKSIRLLIHSARYQTNIHIDTHYHFVRYCYSHTHTQARARDREKKIGIHRAFGFAVWFLFFAIADVLNVTSSYIYNILYTCICVRNEQQTTHIHLNKLCAVKTRVTLA